MSVRILIGDMRERLGELPDGSVDSCVTDPPYHLTSIVKRSGSGSTLIAADAEQFDAIGCELSPDYAAIAERRVRDAAGMFAEVQAA